MPWSDFWDPETPLTFSYPDDWTLIWEESLQLLSARGSAITWSLFAGKISAGDALLLSEQDLAAGPAISGRSWTLSRRNLMVMVTYFADAAAMEAERAVVDAILASARLEAKLPEDAEALAAEVELGLRRLFPDQAIERVGFGLEVEGRGTLDLGNVYRAIRADPEQREARIEQCLELFETMQRSEEILEDFEQASERLFPLLVAAKDPDASRLLRPLNPSLRIAYSVDFGPVMARVTPDLLSSWGVDADHVHERALENLSKRHPLRTERATRDGCRCVLLDTFTFATGQVLLPEYHAAISPMLGESFLVAMPGRDSVVAAAESDIDALSRFAAADFESAPFALTPELFRCSPGKLEPAGAERGWLRRLFGR